MTSLLVVASLLVTMSNDAPTLHTILAPVIAALASIGLSRAARDLRRAKPERVFDALTAASDGLFDIFDLDRHLREEGRRGFSKEVYERIDAVHELVLQAMSAVAAMRVAA